MKFEFIDEVKKEAYNARIKVMGLGGAGGNAINNMISSNLKGVEFVVANTDSQDLEQSLCSHKIQLGPSITMGLGAGADPDIGRTSAEESITELKEALERSDLVFIAAGMGGGTGTGAAPVAARESRESGALTVAVVTKPFKFEGEPRMKRALSGIEALKNQVDGLIVIPNERLKSLGDKATPLKDLFVKADEVLLQAVKGISDLIMSRGFINLDFADVKKVMEQMGTALMGMGSAGGENRACEAAQKAINSPLLEDISIDGAKGLLMNITGPPDMTMEEVEAASNYIKNEVNDEAEIFWGMVLDDNLEDEVQVTVIATGIDGQPRQKGKGLLRAVCRDIPEPNIQDYDNVVKLRDVTPEDIEEDWVVRKNGVSLDTVNLDTPTFMRKGKDLPDPTEENISRPEKKGFFNRFRMKESLDYPTFLRAKAD
ncbi:MAG: cell division protein FtsZ [Deltaproteobacteria bacterium]|nr:cell division protein FtsZ [Deltaproteobacteria bacterium]MBW2047164.1 cell division protein FtsZ [Deltaproteobacteria bacterium]MBW2109841.1 cell division protein FtsZ [Deltaproteobacteria bacterium]MBW2352551.1 cell division protein FtsZ [Deltaproteobacteria bacterium]HDZ89406.1 cell division protein FtsZ [Deltaproteobacteria bacterium]